MNGLFSGLPAAITPLAVRITPLGVVATLLAIDLVFAFLYVFGGLYALYGAHGVPELLHIGSPVSLAAPYMYAKFAVAAFILRQAGRRWRARWTLPLAVACFVLFVDDAFEIHEELGGVIARVLDYGPILNLREKDGGELTMMVVMAAIVFSATALAWLRAPAPSRRYPTVFAVLFVTLGLVGGVADMLGIMARGLPFYDVKVGAATTLFEDGGEMVVATLIVGFAVLTAAALARDGTQGRPPVRA
ncbi:hypothetical protein [Jannaschia sp. LMIT008]|uniref:hypothetical protein n=1 Tax=Jannaschia maritima TaxID=3032585 RepID=UPI002811758E|nr:hypothetical protein [Jannaschia sp. LMIT008]